MRRGGLECECRGGVEYVSGCVTITNGMLNTL